MKKLVLLMMMLAALTVFAESSKEPIVLFVSGVSGNEYAVESETMWGKLKEMFFQNGYAVVGRDEIRTIREINSATSSAVETTGSTIEIANTTNAKNKIQVTIVKKTKIVLEGKTTVIYDIKYNNSDIALSKVTTEGAFSEMFTIGDAKLAEDNSLENAAIEVYGRATNTNVSKYKIPQLMLDNVSTTKAKTEEVPKKITNNKNNYISFSLTTLAGGMTKLNSVVPEFVFNNLENSKQSTGLSLEVKNNLLVATGDISLSEGVSSVAFGMGLESDALRVDRFALSAGITGEYKAIRSPLGKIKYFIKVDETKYKTDSTLDIESFILSAVPYVRLSCRIDDTVGVFLKSGYIYPGKTTQFNTTVTDLTNVKQKDVIKIDGFNPEYSGNIFAKFGIEVIY